MKFVEIYTDGACKGNPGPGGWGTILMCEGHTKELHGGCASTTNNQMELTAAIEGLSALKERCSVKVYSDSSYLVNAFVQGWLDSWKRNGWRKADNKPVLNADLWKKLIALTEQHSVTFIWVKGHAGNPYNEQCDRLAVAEAARYDV